MFAPIQRIERRQSEGGDDEEGVAHRIQGGLPPLALACFAKHLPGDDQQQRRQGDEDASPRPHLVHVKAVSREQSEQP